MQQLRLTLWCLILLLVSSAGAHAQLNRLDDARFIQGLRERHMKELLLYYLDKNPPSDPVQLAEIKIEQQMLRVEDDKAAPQVRAAAVDDVLNAYRELLKVAPFSHHKQPIWKTDMAKFILETALPFKYVNAAEFVEFGEPTKAQRKAFDDLAAEAGDIMDEAGDDLFRLMGDLPRRRNFVNDFDNTGFWAMLRDEVAGLSVPFYKSWAFYESSMVSKPKDAQRRLAAAREELTRLLAGGKLSPAGKVQAESLLGRVLIKLNAADKALEHLDVAIKDAPKDSMIQLTAELAKTEALHQLKKDSDAINLVHELETKVPASQSPVLLILTYDREFAISGDQSVYPRLFNSSEAAQWKPTIEKYVNDRIVERSAATPKDPSKLASMAPLEVLANADAMTAQANDLKAKAGEATDKEEAKKLRGQANDIYKKVEEALKDFLARDDKTIDDTMRAQALFKQGVAFYQHGMLFDAATALVELVEKYPKDPQAAQAAEYAVLLAQEVYSQHKDNDKAIAVYDKALKGLLTNFPDSPKAPTMWYTRGVFLREQKRYDEAVEAYEKVPQNQEFYISAAYESLYCRVVLWREMPAGNERTAASDVIINKANDALRLFDTIIPKTRGDRAKTLLHNQGDTLLLQAEVMAAAGQAAKAFTALTDFDVKYAQFPDLVTSKRQMAISILVQLGRVAEARNEIEKYINVHPDEGGPMIKSVLDRINEMTRQARLRNAPDEAKKLAETGMDLGQFLLDWAKRQPQYANDPKAMSAFNLILVDQLLNAEKFDEALKIYDDLYQKTGGDSNIDVLYGRGRALFHLEKYDDAKAMLSKILTLAPDKSSPIVWDCWVMYLTIMDKDREALAKTDEKAAGETQRKIFTSILKLERFDKELGGGRYKEALKRLELRNQPQ